MRVLVRDTACARSEHPCPGDNVSIRPKDTDQVKILCQSTERDNDLLPEPEDRNG